MSITAEHPAAPAQQTTAQGSAARNMEVMQEVYAAFTRGDVETAAGYWRDDCTHFYPGHSPLAGAHRGIESALGFAGRMFEITEGQIEMTILDLGASEAAAYARVHTAYRKGDLHLEMMFVNISTIVDGQIQDFWTLPEDQYAVDEFWHAALAAEAA